MMLELNIDGQTKLKALADGLKVIIEPMSDDAVLASIAILKELVNRMEQHPFVIREKADVYQRAVKWAARNPGVTFRAGDLQSRGYAWNADEATAMCFRLLADGIVKQVAARKAATGRPSGPRFEVIGGVKKNQYEASQVSTKGARKFFQTMNAMNAINQA